jgi:hypothetical protein
MAENIEFRLEVPLDASQVKGFNLDRALKVIAYGKRLTVAGTAKLDAQGKGGVAFVFREAPGSLKVLVGPENVSPEDLKHLQTLSVDVPASKWGSSNELRLPPIVISSYYWRWWLTWCQEFKVTGRVLCADGSPVAGATVCAFDVDWWWWWTSQEQVGCSTTDATGSFEIDFTRCCGWWPWWWWALRDWQLDPIVAEKIIAFLRTSPQFTAIPTPSPKPSLDVFTPLLSSAARGKRVGIANQPAARGALVAANAPIDPTALDALRTRLLEVLPPDFPFHIWPWYPWFPWWDCGANLIFSVTQNCGGQTNTIVSQTIADTQWDVPTNYNVTLTSSSQACCQYRCPDCPEGNCLVPTDICLINVGSIGGNIGSPVLPNPQPSPPPSAQEGLYDPGVQDRPFAGTVDLYGLFGTGAAVDYYEFQYATPTGSTQGPGPYAPLPLAALESFSRLVLVPAPFPIDFQWVPIGFPVNTISDGVTNHYVYETIAHYEANNGPQTWDSATHDLLLPMNTPNILANGTYYLRLVGYTRPGYSGNLTLTSSLGPDPGVLTVCDPNPSDPVVENVWVVTLDNQAPGNTDPSGNPLYPNPAGCPPTAGAYCQPCGSGTIHACTNQPTTDIFRVQIVHLDGTTTPVGPCGNAPINCTDILEVDFVAYDPDAFLYEYTLNVYYSDNLSNNLLALSTTNLTSGVITTAWAPAAGAEVGPDYADALTQGAVSPSWAGGALTLKVNASQALPMTCAYLLQLVAYKRTIVDCDAVNYDQYNVSEWSFTIQNNCTGS